jgi:hypothetical protein
MRPENQSEPEFSRTPVNMLAAPGNAALVAAYLQRKAAKRPVAL